MEKKVFLKNGVETTGHPQSEKVNLDTVLTSVTIDIFRNLGHIKELLMFNIFPLQANYLPIGSK